MRLYKVNVRRFTPDIYFIVRLNSLKQESGVDVERAVAVLFLYYRVFAELAYRQAVLECHDEVLVHDEAQTATDGDVWAVVCYARLCYICIILSTVLLIATE